MGGFVAAAGWLGYAIWGAYILYNDPHCCGGSRDGDIELPG